MSARRVLALIAAAGAGAAGLACGALLFGESPSANDDAGPSSSAAEAGSGDGAGSFVQVDPGADASDAANAADAADAGRACPADFVLCHGLCVTGKDCTACAGEPLLCEATGVCGSTCAACAGSPIECFACDELQKNPRGTCESADTNGFCLNGDYTNAYPNGGEHCDCSNTNVANCVGAQQVCLPESSTDWCVTCGEKGLPTDGKPCKGGGVCNTALSPPRCQ